MIADSVLANARAYMKGELVDCFVALNDGKILKIGKETHMPKADVKIDLKHQVVLPGLIDAHVHLRDEGKAYKEDFYSGTASAAAGGFATVIDMPNNEPVTMNAAALRNRMNAAEKRILIDVGFRSEFPRNIEEIEGIVGQGALGFKLFMAEQIGGLDPNDDQAVSEAFKAVSRFALSIAVHAEDGSMLKKAETDLKRNKRNDVTAFLKAHSEDAELKAVTRTLDIARQARIHLHFCHVSTREGLEAMTGAKKSGVRVSCEATPHHLFLSVGDLKHVGMLGVVMPPVREKTHALALWDGVRNGWVDIVASDHAPHALREKEAGSVWEVKVGMPGLETTLPLLLTEVNGKRMSIGDVARLLSEKPAQLFGLERKGNLREQNDADFTVIDLYARFRIDASKFLSKAKYSPFDGREVEGKPVKTFVGGQLIMEDGVIVAKAGSGRIVRREAVS